MMSLLSLLIRTLGMLLFLAFGAVADFVATEDLSQVIYPVNAQNVYVQPISLTNGDRAPPAASKNVNFTGATFAQTGDLRTFDGAETSGAVYAILRSSIALNRGYSTSRTEFNQRFSGFPSKAHADDAWAAYRSTSTDTRPIAMGRLEATEVSESLGFQRLNVRNWNPEVNDAWVQGGIDARRSFFIRFEWKVCWTRSVPRDGVLPQHILP